DGVMGGRGAAVPSGSSRSVRHFKDDRAFDMSEVGPTDKTTRRALTGRVRIGHNVRLPDSPSRSGGRRGGEREGKGKFSIQLALTCFASTVSSCARSDSRSKSRFESRRVWSTSGGFCSSK